MEPNEAQETSLQETEAETVESGKLDLSKYRTRDLVARLSELLSLPKAFGRIVRATFTVALLFVIVSGLLLYGSEASAVPWLIAAVYSLAAGIVFGFLLGALRIADAALRNLESILEIILDIADRAAKDHEQLQTDEAFPLSEGELLKQILEDVVTPAMEEAVAGLFGPLRKPLLWIYGRTISAAIRKIVRRVQFKEGSGKIGKAVSKGTESSIATIAKHSGKINTVTSVASTVVGATGGAIRKYVLPLCYILFFMALSIGLVPLIALRFFVTGEGN